MDAAFRAGTNAVASPMNARTTDAANQLNASQPAGVRSRTIVRPSMMEMGTVRSSLSRMARMAQRTDSMASENWGAPSAERIARSRVISMKVADRVDASPKITTRMEMAPK